MANSDYDVLKEMFQRARVDIDSPMGAQPGTLFVCGAAGTQTVIQFHDDGRLWHIGSGTISWPETALAMSRHVASIDGLELRGCEHGNVHLAEIPPAHELINGEERNQQHPATFDIPTRVDREGVTINDSVKLGFDLEGGGGERMWVKVEGKFEDGTYFGFLDNIPVTCVGERLELGDVVEFGPEHILEIEKYSPLLKIIPTA